MLAKENRLTKDKEFDNAFKKGKGSYDKIIGVKAALNNLPQVRFGTLISIKISKKATERNKIKRRVREVIKKELPSLKIGYDIVLIAQPEIIKTDFPKLEKIIVGHFKKLRLYK